MRWSAKHLVAGALAVCLAALFAGSLAMAVSRSDVAYFDGFQDLSGLDAARSKSVALDALGGVRLVTKGAAEQAVWTSKTNFTAPAAPLGPVVGLPTLDAQTTSGSLTLLDAPLAFRRSQAGPVLAPATPLSVDGYGVGGMCVQRVEGTYYMWYTGVPENEFAQRIYLATSEDGLNWAKEPTPVIDLGESGTFDSRQLGKPSVVYDPANVEAPFRMWYAGEGDLGGSIGYATSLDGRTWTKAGEVFGPGKIGTADSYRVTHPCVLVDNGVYYMWYTADDSNNLRVAYATSTDGVTWERGGVVFDVGTGNYSEAAFAPAVVKLGTETPADPGDDGFHMIFTGNKIVAGGEIQSKLINASSADGLTWAAGNIAFSAAGGDTAFDGYNVSQPAILHDAEDATHPYKMWYVGNNPDANGNFHDRIGLAYQKSPSTVTQWVKVPGVAGDPYYESFVTLGEQGDAFDSMKVADLRPVAKPAAAGSGVYGFYTGTNAADFAQRIGVVQSEDAGTSWTDANGHATLVDAGPVDAFDAGGVACPAPVVDQAGGWWLLHTSFDALGAPSIGLHHVSEDLATVTRTAAAPVLASGGLYDAAGQADPYAVDDDGTLVVFYAGRNATGVWSLGVATSAAGDPAALGGARQILAPAAGGYDAGGLRKPVAYALAAGGWRLFYCAIDADGVERIASATSATGSTWTREGLVMTPATAAYDFAEAGVQPSAAGPAGPSGATLLFNGTDRFGWTRIGKAAATGPGYLEGGSATYEFDNPTARDWRRILWTADAPESTDAQIWVSYYPTYSGDWSGAFPIAASNTDLPFLLTVQSMRWQVRMTSTDPAASPRLDDLTVNHAPVEFPTTGKAVTLPIGPPDGLYLLTWGDLTLTCDLPGGTGVTLAVEDDAGAQVVAPQAVTAGSTTIPLAGVAPLGGRLVALCALSGDGTATPKLKSLAVSYTTTTTPAQLTLTASRAPVTFGQSVTLSGSLYSDPTPLVPDDGNTTPLTGQEVKLKAYPAGATGYTELATATTGPDGTFTFPALKPAKNTSYRAEWAGGTLDTVTYPPASAGVLVQVKPKITLTVAKYNSRSGKYYRYKLGRTVYLRGALTPKHAGAKVTVKVYKYKATTRTWAKLKSASRTLTTKSAYTWSWKPTARGTYRVVTTFAGDADHIAGASVYRYIKVY